MWSISLLLLSLYNNESNQSLNSTSQYQENDRQRINVHVRPPWFCIAAIVW